MIEGSNTTERLRRYWDKHASGYDREMAFLERMLFPDGRAWVCSQVTGDVLEVAIGTGRNLPFYPAEVHLTGVEFSPAMLDLARQRAQTLGRQVDLRLGDATVHIEAHGQTAKVRGLPDDWQLITPQE